MSGAFEVAAGAFAVVGVADVLVRSIFQLSSFLRDVADAPKDIVSLRESLDDVMRLYQVTKRYHANLKTRTSNTTPSDTALLLESAAKSLNREVQSLKLLISKFKGSKTGSRVRFTLSEAKVKRSLQTLSQAEALLGNALTIVCREQSAIDHENTKAAVLQSDSTSQSFFTRIENQQQVLSSQSKSLHQQLATEVRDRKQHLATQSSDQHQQLLVKLDVLTRLGETQKTISSGITTQSSQIVTQVSDQHCQLLSVLHNMQNEISVNNHTHQSKLSTILQLQEQLVSSQHTKGNMQSIQDCYVSPRGSPEKSQRTICFLGERSDKKLQYLLALKDDVNWAINRLFAGKSDPSAKALGQWLRSEWQNLISSAFQEGAAEDPNSTAMPFDSWIYPYDGFTSNDDDIASAQPHSTQGDNTEISVAKTVVTLPATGRRQNQTLSVVAPDRNVLVSIPRTRSLTRGQPGVDEVSFTCVTTQDGKTQYVHVRFLRDLSHALQPKLYAQLNVFTKVKWDDVSASYVELLIHGSLSDIDRAIREGTISPFQVDEDEDNLCLYIAARYKRLDVIDYLESQGVGLRALNHDSSLLTGFWWTNFDDSLGLSVGYVYADFVRRVSSQTNDQFSTLLGFAWTALVDYVRGRTPKTAQINSVDCLGMLLAAGCDADQKSELLEIISRIESGMKVSALVGFIEVAQKNEFLVIGPLIAETAHAFMRFASYDWPKDGVDLVDILSALIKVCTNLNTTYGGLTISQRARLHYSWTEWGEALESNGKTLKDVVEKEGNSWLFDENWKQIWKERGLEDHGYLESDSDDDTDDEDESGGSDWYAEAEEEGSEDEGSEDEDSEDENENETLGTTRAHDEMPDTARACDDTPETTSARHDTSETTSE